MGGSVAADIAFGTDGWRSTVTKDFNDANVALVARAIANFLHKGKMAHQGCVIGYDTRAHSETFADVVARALARNGVTPLKMNTFCPTPQTAFAVEHEKAAGAIMLTASHNPPEYNGIKFIPHYAGPATVEITSEIEREIRDLAGRAVDDSGKGPAADVKDLDVSNSYIDQLLGLIDGSVIEETGIRVLFDAMYGASQDVFKSALLRIDCDVVPLHCSIDPRFGGLLPEPIESNLAECRIAVLENAADIGVALDGDADRFGAIDSEGVYLSPNEALTLILWYLVAYKHAKGSVARTVATTHMLDTIAERNGCRVLETPVGFKYIGELMRKEEVILGCEESGGMSVAGHIPEKDGLLAGLILIEIASAFEKPLSALLDEVYAEYGHCYDERIDVAVADDQKEALLESLRNNPPRIIGDKTVVKTDLRDGVKVITKDQTWLLVRASGTEPLVRVYVEARSEEAFSEARASAVKIVKGKRV
jgi:alpha-D-glucose phosphate-specific phosphoglucomutase